MAISTDRQEELKRLIKSTPPAGVILVRNSQEADFVTRCNSIIRTSINQKSRESVKTKEPKVSDGSSADYYKLPRRCTQLQDLIAYRNMNAQLGEIFRATFRYGVVHHSPKERDLNKIIYYARAELARLKKYESVDALELNVEDL